MKKILNTFKLIFSILAQCITPVLTLIIGIGMLKLALLLFSETAFNIMPTTSNTYMVLSFIGDCAYYFLPIFVAFSAGEVFKTNKYLAAFLGSVLLAPGFVECVSNNQNISIFNLPIVLTDYSSQLISPILIVWIFSFFYNYLDSKVDERYKTIVVPAVTITLMVPIIYCFIGPIGVKLGELLTSLVYKLNDIGPLGGAIYTCLMPIICILGLGPVDFTITLSIISSGADPICFFNNLTYNVLLGVVVFMYYLKTKENEAIASAITSAIAGVSEPALFGIVVKNMYLLIPLCLACFITGFLNSILNIKSYIMASMGIIGAISTLGGDTPFYYSIITLVIGSILAYIFTKITLNKIHE